MLVKLEDFVKPFKGKGDTWDLFSSKFSVLADVSGWDTEDKYMSRLPLFLEGDAFLVFTRMSDVDKKKKEVQEVMVKSFSVVKDEAYGQFSRRKLKPDESPDAFVVELRRLLEASGHKVQNDKDSVLISQVLAGLPSNVYKQVWLAFAGKDMAISGCLEAVRALLSVNGAPLGMAGPSSTGSVAASNVVCHRCGGTGHFRKACRKRSSSSSRSGTNGGGNQSGAQRGATGSTCFFCDKSGHMKKDCPPRKQWLAQQDRMPAAAAQDQSATLKKCLCTVSANAEPPRMYVEVAGKESSQDPCRVDALVDTGSTQTLVAESVASCLNLEVMSTAPGDGGIVALDGKPLNVLGTMDIVLSHLDGPVHLGPVTVTALVVPSLSVVHTVALIGSDVVQACGGLQLVYDDAGLSGVRFGASSVDESSSDARCAVAAPRPEVSSKLSRHVEVSKDSDDVTLSTDDGEIRWCSQDGFWKVKWKWTDGQEPAGPLGPAIGEYPRKKLSVEEEKLFQAEVQAWIDNGWLIKHDSKIHGEPAAVLPLMAVPQQHKSTPVRPVLDYCALNDCIVSMPGADAPVCEDTLRKWRREGDPKHCRMLDIRKAYLQVRMSSELLRYQTVLWKGQRYVMTWMGFGLSVAPKFMDVIIRYVTRDEEDVDNYVDDLRVPEEKVVNVIELLARYGLPTKPAEEMSSARVLGLQLSENDSGTVWSRRSGVSIELPEVLTKRSLFSWCGRVISHYPVGPWLRPCCSWLKRVACELSDSWDRPLPSSMAMMCSDLINRMRQEDPATGAWHVDVSSPCTVYCDASDIALGAVIEVGDNVIEDSCWLRTKGDKRHINIAELDAVIKGVTMAAKWGLKNLQVVTDSKTVASWLQLIVNNVHRVMTSGLHELLVERRLQIFDDMIATGRLALTVQWVPSADNHADRLTRVPAEWLKIAKKVNPHGTVAAAVQPLTVIGPISLDRVHTAQQACPTVSKAYQEVKSGTIPSAADYKKVRDQLMVQDDILCRSVKLPLEGTVVVPVIPESMEEA